ncbi:MAG: hypothetical protein HOB33_12220 [Bacteroidetes Order II. Incertae sedis bacterium]|nr:hypothetical protein [Bacteroidetes Order II. bacterium]
MNLAQRQAFEPTFTKVYVESESDVTITDEAIRGRSSSAYVYVHINCRAGYE